MANDPLNWLLLAEVIVVVIVASAFLFYWNRLGGRVIAWLIRLYAWRRHNAYISIGSLQISPLAGRIAFRDIQYHSSNLSVRALHGHVTFRYWWARVRQEGDAQSGNAKRQKMPSRIMVNLEGVEMFVFNRTPAYDNIVERMKKHEREEAAAAGKKGSNGSESPVKQNPITLRLRKVYKSATAGKGGDEERLESVDSNDSASSESGGKINDIPNIVRPADTPAPLKASSVDWFREMLPIDIRVQTGSVILGSDATPMLLIGGFKRAEGKLEITDSRSICDKYKLIVDLRFEKPKVIYRTNKEYSGPLLAHGKKVYDKIVQEKPEITKQPPSRMTTRPAFQALAKILAFIRDPDFSIPPIKGLPTDRTWKGLARYQDHEPVNKPFVESKEYAKVSTLLETPLLELTYFADTPGLVPDRSEIATPDAQDEFGNVDLPPEYGIDINIHGGTVNYGPWADRQRDALQRAFAPSIFFNTQPMTRLRKGDTRVHANLALTVQICEETTLRIPTRDPSRDWRFAPDPAKPVDSNRDGPMRYYAWMEVKVGANSSVIYSQAQYATKSGYDSMVVLHLDSIRISSSVNDTPFITARACKLSVTMPTPLEWNAQRNWGLDVTLENPKIALLRDHVTLISDLSRDWSSGATADYHHFVPMHYNFRVALLNYDVRLYINDNNIIDHPGSVDENAFVVVAGPRLTSYVSVDTSRYRPESSLIPFTVNLENAKISLILPTWDTHHTFTCTDALDPSRPFEIGKVSACTASGSYRYYSTPHPDHQETLMLHLDAERVAFKCLGWVLRRLFCVKDNYFGMFTQSSTSTEFLHRHAADPKSVGDPVEEKYHPGRSDALAVNVTLDVRDSLILLSDEIYACTSGIAMPVPQFQMMLKSVEAFMEMSLDAPPTYIVEAPDFAKVYETMRPRTASSTDSVYIEGLSIKANRLFGPQPRGATYLCLWEAAFPRIKANVTPSFIVTLKQTIVAVIYNFNDEENAPTKLYLPASDPDVTFFKLALGSASIKVAVGNNAVEVDLPRGINLDTSTLATLTSISSIGILIPEVDVSVLIRPDDTAAWSKISSLSSGASVDIYNNPDDCVRRAGEQQRFIRHQDNPTRRVWYMYAERKESDGNHQHTVYVPTPNVAADNMSEYGDDSDDKSSSGSDTTHSAGMLRGMASARRSFVTAWQISSDPDDHDTEEHVKEVCTDAARLGETETGMHGGILVKGLPSSAKAAHGRLIRLRLRPVKIHAKPVAVESIGIMAKVFRQTTPRPTQVLDNLLVAQVDATLAGLVNQTPLTLDATIGSVMMKIDTDVNHATSSYLRVQVSDAAVLLRRNIDADGGMDVAVKLAALAVGLDASMASNSMVHLAQVDPRYKSVNASLLRLEQRGAAIDLTTRGSNAVMRLHSAAADIRFVTATLECTLSTAKIWAESIGRVDFGPKRFDTSLLIRGLVRPEIIERREFTELRPIFASVKSSPLHKEDDRNIRLNHGWRVLSQLRVLHAAVENANVNVFGDSAQGVEAFCERLGGLDWFGESAYALTLNQPFVQQVIAEMDGGETGQNKSGERTITLSSDIFSIRHYDRLLGEKRLGVSSLVVTGVAVGAVIRPGYEAAEYRVFGAIKSVGIDLRDSLFSLAKSIPLTKTAAPGPPPKSQESQPSGPIKLVFDIHLASGGIDITAGGLRLTTIVGKLHLVGLHDAFSVRTPTSILLTYDRTTFALLALANTVHKRDYPVIGASTDGLRVVVTRQSGTASASRVRVLVGLQSLQIETKAQLRSFLTYVQEWKDKHQAHYTLAISDLRARLPASGSTKPHGDDSPIVTADITLRQADVKIRAAKAVWVVWAIGKSYLCGNGTMQAFRIGISLDPQELKAIASDSLETNQSVKPTAHEARLRLPSIRVNGSAEQSGTQRSILANVQLGALTGKIKPVVLDRLLSLYQRLGTDMRQIYRDYRSEATNMLAKQSAPQSDIPIVFDVRVDIAVVRIALQAEKVPAAILFEALSLQGSASNRRTVNRALEWFAKAHQLSLSLGALNSGPLSERIEATRRHRSAYMQLDVEVREAPGDIHASSQLSISLSKVHTVMQISALSEISDLLSSWTSDLHVLKEKRAAEVAEVKERTSRILKRIEASERGIQPELSWFASRLLHVEINGFAVAVPLGKDMAIDLRPKHGSVPAMLFSIRSITFQNRRNETARFRMQHMMLQFLHSFDQYTPTQFAGEYHQTDNLMALPHIDAEAQMSSTAELWTLTSHSRATDFKLTLAPSIVNHVFQLIDLYEEGREHIAQLEKHYFAESVDPERALPAEKGSAQRIACRMSFEFQSGVVDLVHHGAQTGARRPSLKKHDLLELPKISVWLDYMGPHKGADGSAVINMAVHGSQNELRPTILPFFVDLASRVERRATQKQKKHAPSTSHSNDTPAVNLAKVSTQVIRVSATLRIDRSKLRLFDPDSQAYLDLEWESGGFLAKTTIGAEENSTFAGTISGVTTELSNSNEPENACIRATARDMAVSVVFAPQWQEDYSGISIVFDTKVSAQFDLDKFSSWLTFVAVWIDNAPSLDTPIAAAITESASAPHVGKRLEKRKMGVAILARFQAVDFDAHLDVTHAKLSIKPIVLQSISDGQRTRVDLRIGVTEVSSSGQVSGSIRSEHLSLHTVRKSSRAAHDVDPQLLNMSIHAGDLSGHLLLRDEGVAKFKLEPSVVQLYDNWQDASAPPNLTFAVDAGKLTAVTRLQSIAELLERVYDVLDLVERQHYIANQRSEAFRNRALQRRNEPSPITTALMQSMQKAGKATEGEQHEFAQVMHFRLAGIDLGVYNNQPDKVNELYRFVFGDLEAYLTRVPKKEEGKDLQSRDLKLKMGFFRWDSTETKQWSPELDQPDKALGEVLAKLIGSRPMQAASLPSVDLHVESTEDIAAAVLTYTLILLWGNTDSDIAVMPSFFFKAFDAMNDELEGIEHAEKRRWRHFRKIRPSDASLDEPNLRELAARRLSAAGTSGRRELKYVSTDPDQELPIPKFTQLGSGTQEFARVFGNRGMQIAISKLPRYSHRFVTLSLEEGMDLLLQLYAKQLPDKLT